MTKKNLLIVGGIGVAMLIWSKAQALQSTINGLKLSFLPSGLPTLTSGKVVFPLTVRVDNPSPLPIPLDSLRVAIHRVETNGTSYLVAQTPPEGVKLTTFAAKQSTVFKLELELGLLDAVAEFYKIYQKRGFNRFRIESTVGAGMVQVPITSSLSL